MLNDSIFPMRLKMAREEAGLKQKNLADLVHVSPQTISGYEKTTNGKVPSLEMAATMAKTLNVSLDWLIGLTDNQSMNSGKEPLETLGDVVETLELVLSAVTAHIEKLYLRHEEDYERTGIVFYRDDEPQLVKYLNGRETMIRLLEENTISQELFDSWKNGEIIQLKGIPLDLPF